MNGRVEDIPFFLVLFHDLVEPAIDLFAQRSSSRLEVDRKNRSKDDGNIDYGLRQEDLSGGLSRY